MKEKPVASSDYNLILSSGLKKILLFLYDVLDRKSEKRTSLNGRL